MPFLSSSQQLSNIEGNTICNRTANVNKLPNLLVLATFSLLMITSYFPNKARYFLSAAVLIFVNLMHLLLLQFQNGQYRLFVAHLALCDICWPYISVFCSHCAWCLNSCGLWRDVDRAVLKRCWRVLFSHSWMELRLDWVNCTVHWMIYETSARGTHKHVLRCPLMLFCQVPAWPNSSYSHQKPL